MVEIMARETKKDQRKAKRHNPHESKKKERTNHFHSRKLFHPQPF